MVEESEYTGAGKAHTAQPDLCGRSRRRCQDRQKHEEETPGTNIIIPATPQDIRKNPVDMDEMRRKHEGKMNVKDKGFDNLDRRRGWNSLKQRRIWISQVLKALDYANVSIA